MLLTEGFLADFKTGYMQIAIPEHRCEVRGGTDDGAGGTGSGVTAGFAVGRLVKLTRLSDGSCHIEAATSISATSIGDATHIVAQSDDTLDTTTIRGEVFNYLGKQILKNTTAGGAPSAASATMKRVALWKIVNADDVKIIPVKPASVSVVR